MALSPGQLDRYARHVLLAEIGEAGQERLLHASFWLEGLAPSAASIAREYMERAGMAAAEPAAATAAEPAAATASVLGAWHAVEQIKATLGLGTPAAFPATLLEQLDVEVRD